MNDLFGLLFFVLLVVGIFVGLKVLSKPQKRSAEEFEKRASEGSGGLGASLFALQKILNPEAVRLHETKLDLKGGRYNKKKREGKGNGNLLDEENINEK